MNMDKKINRQDQLIISKLSITSFLLAVISYLIFVTVSIFHELPVIFVACAPLIVILLITSSFILSILDLTKTNRKKIFSVIALILSSLYFLFLVGGLIIVQLFG